MNRFTACLLLCAVDDGVRFLALLVLIGGIVAFPAVWFFTVAQVCRASGFRTYGELLGVSLGYTAAMGAAWFCVEAITHILLYIGWREQERAKKVAAEAKYAAKVHEESIEQVESGLPQREPDCCEVAPPDCAIRVTAGVTLLLALCIVVIVEPFVVPWAVMTTDNYGDALAKMLIVAGGAEAAGIAICVAIWLGIGIGCGTRSLYLCVRRMWSEAGARGRDYSTV